MRRRFTSISIGITAFAILTISGCDRFSEIFFQDLYAAVEAVQTSGDGLLVVGDFSRANGEERNNIVRLNGSGKVDEGFPVSVDGGVVYTVTLASIGDETVAVIGGTFTSVNGIARTGVAALTLDGTVVNSFAPEPAPPGGGIVTVRKVLPTGERTILLAGRFGIIDGVAGTENMAELDLETGAPRADYTPRPSAEVYDVTPGLPGTLPARHVIVGAFADVGGEATPYAAAIDRAGVPVAVVANSAGLGPLYRTVARNSRAGTYITGGQLGINSADGSPYYLREFFERIETLPDGTFGYVFASRRAVPEPNAEVYAVAPFDDGGYLAGGAFSSVELDSAEDWRQAYLFAADAGGRFVSSFTPLVDGPVYAIHTSGSFAYVGGAFSSFENGFGATPVESAVIRLDDSLKADPDFTVTLDADGGAPVVYDMVTVAEFE